MSVLKIILQANILHEFSSGWTQRRLPSMDTEDFETIPSSAEESSNSSEEEGNHKNVGNVQDHSSCWLENVQPGCPLEHYWADLLKNNDLIVKLNKTQSCK